MPRRYAGFDAITRGIRAFWGSQNRKTRRRAGRREQVLSRLEGLEGRALLAAAGYVENQVILQLQPGSSVDDLESAYPGSEVNPLGDYGLYLMTLPSGSETLTTISTLNDRPEVLLAQPDWIGEWSATPNDPDFGQLWGLRNTGQTVNGVAGTAGADIDATLAWDITQGSTTVIAAIVDSGVDWGHPDLAASIWANPGEIAGNGLDDDANGFVDDIRGWDFPNNDADPMDFVGHGTHVAGTVGAIGNNGVGLTGVNWNVKLMPLKIGTDLGGPTTSGAIGAINYAVDMGATVSNHSYSVGNSPALQAAVTYAQQNNHIVVVAAGNSNLNNDIIPSFPANYTNDNLISVAATDPNDLRAAFSNFGVVSVDIGVPGVNIWSTTPRAGSLFYGPNYAFSDGTSMAAPHVAGAVALLRSLAPNVPYKTIIDAIYNGSDKIASMNGVVSTGGRLNVANAIAQLQAAAITITPGTVREDAGNSGASIAVSKVSWDINTPLTLTLAFDDATEVAVPALAGNTMGSVTIPAGTRTINLPLDVLPDDLLDGTQTVTFTISHLGQVIGTTTLNVTDYEILTLNFDKAAVREDAGPGAANLTLTRSNTDVFPPNVFVSMNNDILEFDNAGVLVNTIPVPWPVAGGRPAGENIHDLVTLTNGRLAVYNGTTTGYVSVYNPTNATWQHFFVPGLSTDAGDIGTGGISSMGNYVFVTDMQASPGNAFGAVRLDLTNGSVTRFAQKSLGNRLFVKDIFGTNILEIDPLTGATVNTLPMPVSNPFGFNTGMAFDGTYLWVMAGPIGNDQIYKLDAETGAVVDVFSLGSTTEYDGLAWLNGLLYIQDSFIQNQIVVYDPITRSVVRTLNVGAVSGVDISGGLAAITGPDRLIATSTSNDDIFEISPVNGAVVKTWKSGSTSTEFGVGVAGGEIYIGEFQSSTIRVFNGAGVFQRTITTTLVGAPGIFAIGGDDIKGLTITPYRYRDLAVGLDDMVYVLDRDGKAVGRYDATSLALDVFFDLDSAVKAIAVYSDGTIYAVDDAGFLRQFDASGKLLRSLDTGVTGLVDIDLNIGGQILMTSVSGEVVRSNIQFAAATKFTAGANVGFAASGKNQTQLAGELIVTLINSDPTEIKLPGSAPYTVTIPAGQQSLVIPVESLTDNVLDGTQIVTVSTSHPSYVGTASASIDVLDTEKVLVDVLADSVSEAAGEKAAKVRVSRTDWLGPYTSPNQQVHTVNTPQTILDRDTIISPITIPDEFSLITDVNVTISLQHSWLGDLDIFLVSPQGTRVELFTDLVSNGSEMVNTTLNDQATDGILKATAPFTGSFIPEGVLGVLNGQNPSGRWTLEVTDDNRLDTGTLLSWTLDIQTVGLAALAVALQSSDTTEAEVQNPVLIPANQREVIVWLDAIDDTLLDGVQVVAVTATNSSLAALELGTDNVNVTDSERLTFTVNYEKVSEAGVNPPLKGRLERFNTDILAPLDVTLSSSDVSELTVPMTWKIPGGSSFAEFDITIKDDTIVDGTQLVTLTATAPAYGDPVTVDVEVEDLEPSLGLTTFSSTVWENAGSFQMTVTRRDQADISQPMLVTLTSSDTTELIVPATILIPMNAPSVSFDVTVINDSILEIPQLVNIMATADGITGTFLQITVNDYETLTVTIDKSSILENAGADAAEITVTRNNTDIQNELLVTLTSSDTTELTVPLNVVIPAGQASTVVKVAAVNDPIVDGAQNVTITASAPGYVDGTVMTTVLDHEPPVIASPVSPTQNPKPTISWNALGGATRYDIWIDNVSAGKGQILRNKNIPAGTTSYVPPESLGIGTYRAWVRAYDALELPGFWSEPYLFTVNTAPAFKSPGGATNQAASTLPVFSWTAVADATVYDLWVDNLTTSKYQVIRQSSLTTTSFIPTTEMTSGNYRMWVRAFNAQGEAGAWSPARNFSVLESPTVTSPTGGTFNRTPTVTWTPVTSAVSYDIQVNNNTTGQIAFRNQFVLGTSYRAPTDLPNGTYTAWVRAYSNGVYSVWSPAQKFSIGLPPVVTSPTPGGLTGNRPQFVWTSLTETARYELWVDQIVNGISTRVIYQTALTTPSFTPTSDLAAGNYRVWVRAISNMGVSTAWSNPVSFTVAAADTLRSTPRAVAPEADLIVLTSLPQVSEEPAAVVVSEQATVSAEALDMVVPVERPTAPRAVVVESEGLLSGLSLLPTIPGQVLEETVENEADMHDAVMAEWSAAEWWSASEKQDGGDQHLAQAALLVAGVGMTVQARRRRGEQD